MSQFRASQIYVSIETRQTLWIIAKATDVASPDEAGEMLLSWAIRERYPTLVDHQKKIKALELEVIESVKEGQ